MKMKLIGPFIPPPVIALLETTGCPGEVSTNTPAMSSIAVMPHVARMPHQSIAARIHASRFDFITATIPGASSVTRETLHRAGELRKPESITGTKKLSNSIRDNLEKVAEFKWLQQLAQKHHIRIYLLGETALSFGMVNKWLINKSAGVDYHRGVIPESEDFSFELFELQYTNQFIELGIEGADDELLEQIRTEINRKFPYRYVHDEKKESLWKVSSVANANKGLNGAKYGIINLSRGETASLDTHQVDFLGELSGEKMNLVYSDTWESKPLEHRFLEVIDCMVTLLEHHLQISKQEMEIIKSTIAEASTELCLSLELKNIISSIGQNLFLNSADIEATYTLLNETHLISFFRKHQLLPDFTERVPLTSRHIDGVNAPTNLSQTVKSKHPNSWTIIHRAGNHQSLYDSELGVRIFQAISRSWDGKGNFLVSRKNSRHEICAEGVGVYTSTRGAGEPYPVRIKVNPLASLGFSRSGTEIEQTVTGFIIKSKDAIDRVIKTPRITENNFQELLLRAINEEDRILEIKLQRFLCSSDKAEEIIKGIISNDIILESSYFWRVLSICSSHPNFNSWIEYGLKHPNKKIAAATLFAVARIPDHKYYNAWLDKGIKDNEPKVRIAAYATLHSQSDPQKLTQYISLGLNDPEAQVRYAVMQLIKSLSKHKDFNHWINLAQKHPNEEVRDAAVSMLSEDNQTKEQYRAHINHALADDQPFVQMGVRFALTRNPDFPSKSQYKKWLKKLKNHPDIEVRSNFVYAISNKIDPLYIKWLQEMFNNDGEKVRALIVQNMRGNEGHPLFDQFVSKGMDDDSHEVRVEAFWAIASSPNHRLFQEGIVKGLSDPEERVREGVLFVLEQIGYPSHTLREAMNSAG